MDVFDALSRSRAELDRRVAAVGAGQWELPTPCSEWDVRALAQHCIGGNRMSVLLLGGATPEEAIAQILAYRPGDSPEEVLGNFRSSADAQDAAFRAPGALARVCHHPVGEIPGARLLGFRIGDMTLHAWDLARALGVDESLDGEVVEYIYQSMLPMESFIATTGRFGSGPSGEVPTDAPTQLRLLDLTGRRP